MKTQHFMNCCNHIWAVAVAMVILSALGCGGGGGGGDGGGTTGTPNVALSNESILYPATVIGQTSERGVTVQNTGTANLVIGQVAKSDTLNAPFSISADNCSGLTLAPNGSCIIRVGFAPTAQTNYSDSFDVPSNDPDRPSLSVGLSGSGQGFSVTITKVDTSAFEDIRMIVSVTDANNEPITGFTADNFSVEEKGNPVAIKFFSDTAPDPSAIAMVLDVSESLLPFADEVSTAAKTFLDQLNVPFDNAAIIKFDGDVQSMLAPDFQGNLVALKAAVDAPYTLATEGTAFNTAVYRSANMVKDFVAANPFFKGSAVVISDGNDAGGVSAETLEEAIEVAQGVPVYTIGFGTYLRPEIMQELADGTGGEYIFSPSSSDLEDAYVRISRIIGNQYEIIFTALNPHLSENELTVSATNGILRGEDSVLVTYP